MSIITFAPAVRKGSHVLIALYGESGSGKTYSAILMARGLVGPAGKIAMIDTETGRGLIYATVAGGYNYAELTPPFTPERYAEAVKAAEEGGFDALILDSASHEWEGIGGIIETAEANNLKGLVKWAGPKSRHKKFVQALLQTRMHLIICLRAKEKMVQRTIRDPVSGREKQEIVSEGFVSVQDKRFIFETTVQLFMLNGEGLHGTYRIEKCPEDLLGAFPTGQKITVETGKRIADWVAGGAPVDHTLELLKRKAEEVAEDGTEASRAHWRTLSAADRNRLQPYLENLKSIAAAADAEAQQQESNAASSSAADTVDPFTGRGAVTSSDHGGGTAGAKGGATENGGSIGSARLGNGGPVDFPTKDGQPDRAAYMKAFNEELALASQPEHIDALVKREGANLARLTDGMRSGLNMAIAKKRAEVQSAAA